MLKLRKIQIQGFKSFADKQELMFNGSGIAAIVGPNGCGKSNISDAIAWVLGEQSPKSLRGGRMEDVIFNGTRSRPPLGLAEVTMTLVDPEVQRESNVPSDGDGPEAETGEALIEDLFEEDSAPAEPAAEANAAPVSEPLEVVIGGGGESSVALAAGTLTAPKRQRRPKLHLKPGELIVSRRLFRSGDSEYLINGRLVRLRDVHEIFMGTGLGPDSYAIIEQGRVGLILSSKPSDRRAIIEEAAGITKFKSKRKLAESKLEQAKQNLLRVNDIAEEVSRQLGSLKRQAAKARRYGELRGRMREVSRQLSNARDQEMATLQAQCQQALERILAEHSAKHQAIDAAEQSYQEGNAAIFAREDQLNQQRGRLSQLALELERGQQKSHFQKQQLEQLAARIQENVREIERLNGQQQMAQQEVETKREALATITAEFERINQQFEFQSSQVEMGQTEVSKIESAAERYRAQLLDCVEQAATLRNQLTQADELERRLDQQISRLATERDEAASTSQQFQAACQQAGQAYRKQEEQLATTRRQVEELSRLVAGLKEEELLVAGQLQQSKESLSSNGHRLKSLEELAAHHAYSTEAVRMLLGAASGNAPDSFRTDGILADHLDVEAPYEAAVEELLKQELEYLLTDSLEGAKAGISLLRKSGAGRSTFLAYGGQQSSGSRELDELIDSVKRSDASLVAVSDIIDFPGQYETAFWEALPHLFRTIIAPNLERAMALAQAHPELIFLTPEGEIVRGRLVSGGGKAAGGHLSLKREIRDLDRKTRALEKEIQGHEEKVQVLRQTLQSRESEAAEFKQQAQELEKQLISSDLEWKQNQRDLDRSNQRQNLARAEFERTRQEKDQIQQKRAECETQIAGMEARKAEIENLIAAQQESLKQLKDRSSQDSLQLSELRSQLATFRERKQGAEAELSRLAASLRDSQERLVRLNSQSEGWARETEEIQASIRQLEEAAFQQAVQKATLEAEIRTMENSLQEARLAQTELEQRLKLERQELEEIQNRKTQTEIERARLSSDRAHLEETCLKELGVALAEIRPEEPLLLGAEELAKLDGEYLDLKNKIEGMGPVNMMALEEFQECEQRHQFLTTQRQDLLDSIQDTSAAIKEIDQVSREQFREAFAAINTNFQETFQSLFGGGHGEMKLLDEQDELESGIEIIAQPPGKRLQNVLLLSGGEKALTAIALLLAIFRYQPSPFCVLDEVDAPLDELNTGRFSQMVQTMSQGTQFVIITHSKRTMEASDTMYGVMMQEAGVSKLVSVKFERGE